jgi:membrane fusion protein (multidrug efflux system)
MAETITSAKAEQAVAAGPVAPSGGILRRFKPRQIILASVSGLLAIVLAVIYLIYSANHETTDDAYTTSDIHDISSRVAGTVAEVLVNDNQFVKQGQVLVRLDPRDFQVQYDKAKADYKRAIADFARVQELRGQADGIAAVSKKEYDRVEASMAIAKAVLDDAGNQLDYCSIIAPEDGFVGNKTVQTGNRVSTGTVLMSVVQPNLWVVANFKETQVRKMRKGQEVRIKVDAIGGHVFTGHVDSFSPGSGSVFALLPPENATGNFTKIVQRIPVKIVFNAESVKGYEERLVPGLSVEANVELIDAKPVKKEGQFANR